MDSRATSMLAREIMGNFPNSNTSITDFFYIERFSNLERGGRESSWKNFSKSEYFQEELEKFFGDWKKESLLEKFGD